jgi:hypothetical protein
MSKVSEELANLLNPQPYHSDKRKAITKALDDYADHIASRVMAHLRGEAGLNVDQFTGNLEEDMKAARLRDSLSEEM